MSKNVTIEMGARVGEWARVEAARNGKRLSGWIAEKLRAVGEIADSSQAARPATVADMQAIRRFLRGGGYAGISTNLPTRDEIHDRSALRRHKSADL